MTGSISWARIAQLCLVNTAIGGLSALPINLFNRLMTVELALPALLPGLLVALHYGVQLSRPVWGHRSDRGGHRTPYILGGMTALGLGVITTAAAIYWAETALVPAMILWVLSYVVIGLGIGAAGTSFLALLASAAPDARKGAAATLAWLLLIVGAVAMTIGVGIALDPYSPERMMVVIPVAVGLAVALSALAVWGVERRATARVDDTPDLPLSQALENAWADPAARRFTGFVFLSILAFFLSELIFEPFAGHVHGMTPDESTTLSGAKDGAALLGMLGAGALSSFRLGSLRMWAMVGCVLSAVGLVMLGTGSPIVPSSMVLGLGNGLFVVGAIGSMMRLAAAEAGATGTRMGVFGAAQAIAAGIAGLVATGLLDIARLSLTDAAAYGALFGLQACLFLAAAYVATRVMPSTDAPAPRASLVPGE